jgi:hypothetical protein
MLESFDGDGNAVVNPNNSIFIARLECGQIRHDYFPSPFVGGAIDHCVSDFEWAFL